MIKSILYLLIGIVIPISIFHNSNNDYSDCSNAYIICDLGDYHIDSFYGSGTQEDLLVKDSQIKETNAHWFTFQADQTGIMEFNIVPDDNSNDIDFILYKSKSESCNKKSPARVMTSGTIIGQPKSSICIGQTGLQETSNDLKETDGCYSADDNYLKPITLDTKSTYYLLVNNYDSSTGFTILFKGKEGLVLRDQCDMALSNELEVEVYPNPTIDYLYLEPINVTDKPVSIEIFDQTGRVFYTVKEESFQDIKKILVSSIPSGNYLIRLKQADKIRLKTFIKQ